MKNHRPKLAGIVASACLVLGCSRPDPVVAEMTPSPPSSTTAASPAPGPLPAPLPVGPTAPRGEVTIASSEADAPPIGAPCTSAPTCGLRGRIALRSFAIHSPGPGPRAERPCSPIGLTPTNATSHYAKSACVSGDRVHATTACILCRMPSRTVSEGVISEMTVPQREFLIRELDLAEPAASLTSAEAWSRAFASAHSRANP